MGVRGVVERARGVRRGGRGEESETGQARERGEGEAVGERCGGGGGSSRGGERGEEERRGRRRACATVPSRHANALSLLALRDEGECGRVWGLCACRASGWGEGVRAGSE
jgi:hypothetical protein